MLFFSISSNFFVNANSDSDTQIIFGELFFNIDHCEDSYKIFEFLDFYDFIKALPDIVKEYKLVNFAFTYDDLCYHSKSDYLTYDQFITVCKALHAKIEVECFGCGCSLHVGDPSCNSFTHSESGESCYICDHCARHGFDCCLFELVRCEHRNDRTCCYGCSYFCNRECWDCDYVDKCDQSICNDLTCCSDCQGADVCDLERPACVKCDNVVCLRDQKVVS